MRTLNRQLVYLMVAAALVMLSAPLGTPEAGDCDCKDIRDIRNRICVAKAAISEYDRHIYRLRKKEQGDGTPVMLTPFRKNEGMKPCVAEAMETVRDKSANSADGETTSESCEVTVNAPTPCLEKSIRIHEGVHERKCMWSKTGGDEVSLIDEFLSKFRMNREGMTMIQYANEEQAGYRSELNFLRSELISLSFRCPRGHFEVERPDGKREFTLEFCPKPKQRPAPGEGNCRVWD